MYETMVTTTYYITQKTQNVNIITISFLGNTTNFYTESVNVHCELRTKNPVLRPITKFSSSLLR